MVNWTFYPVCIATVVSIVGLSRIALSEYEGQKPRTLSELAAAEQSLLVRFRNVLLLCGILFGITVYGFIVPRIVHPALVALFGGLMIGGELLAAVVPARRKAILVHNIMGHVMAIGMLGLGFVFWVGLDRYRTLEMLLTLSMCAASTLALIDKKRYIAYEMSFIYASHFTVLIAALALRWPR